MLRCTCHARRSDPVSAPAARGGRGAGAGLRATARTRSEERRQDGGQLLFFLHGEQVGGRGLLAAGAHPAPTAWRGP